MHINHVMRNLCSVKKQRSFEKIEKIVLKTMLLLCTISKLLLRRGFACLLTQFFVEMQEEGDVCGTLPRPFTK
jgi:hypothetical protein